MGKNRAFQICWISPYLFIYLFLFIFLWLCFVGYVIMRTDCSNCSNFYELVYHYSARGSGLMWAVDSAREYVRGRVHKFPA